MLTATAGRGVALLRHPRRAVRIAKTLWIAWAIVVWNVVFDHVIVVAGRHYIVAATVAANERIPYARMDDWMRPAVARGLWTATAAALAIVVVGFLLIRLADVRSPSGASRPV